MKYLLTIILIIFISCEPNSLIDLTPEDGFNTEWAFNTPKFKASISNTEEVQDTGWYEIPPIDDIRNISPFAKNVKYIATDTFAFEWQDYSIVLNTIQKIANGFDISNSVVSGDYTWLNTGQMYSTKESYLIPLFNSKGQRYWLQVFKEKKGYFSTLYTAMGLWITIQPKVIVGDVS